MEADCLTRNFLMEDPVLKKRGENMNYLKVAAVSPLVTVAHPMANAREIITMLDSLNTAGVQAAVFPELCVTGYTPADLFFQEHLLEQALAALDAITAASRGSDLFFAVGAPLRVDRRLYNCAVAIQNGRVLGIVPKTYIPNENEFYEKRWFHSLGEHAPSRLIPWGNDLIPFGPMVFSAHGTRLALEICEDLWAPIPPSSHLALAGAQVIFNLSASNELIAKADYRRSLVTGQSARLMAGYVYASAGVGESTTDVVFSGHLLIAENGVLVTENQRFALESEFITGWLDLQRLDNLRLRTASLTDSAADPTIRQVPLSMPPADLVRFDRPVDPRPFVPQDPTQMAARCQEIFAIQAHGLAKRLRAIGSNHCLIGISGGLDSTLALLVIRKALAINGADPREIATVTMPGFGTTDRTYQNAVALCRELGTQFREIDIVPAALQHFADIGHDPASHDATYENTQARERTQILMDLANKEGGIVVGTGDLSELALGWATYNGDHMSMYGVNASVPKTLVRYLVRYAAEHESEPAVAHLLLDILDTPISPELLPGEASGEILQKTEDLIGPYELHDFFLYHMLRQGAGPEKLLFLAGHAFQGVYPADVIRQWLGVFLKRFFNNQFKRSALPDGPKVGSVALSPRGDWRMPSDVTWRSWLDELDRL